MKKLYLVALLLSGLGVIVACERGKNTQLTSQAQRPLAYQLSKVTHSPNVLLTTAQYEGVLLYDSASPVGEAHRGLILRALTPAEVGEAELILTRCTQQEEVRWYWRGWQGQPHADTTQHHSKEAIHVLSYYHRQYRGFSTASGQRVVWINAFLQDDSLPYDWKTRDVYVEDGGKAYFNIYINLDTKQCFNFFRNSIGG
ncbi:hypothetical protein FNT36_14350 [Hymenobacter setariae]|uniref:Lipoprotein n=1 Tax=Hymenobacter setariae TaxID=2594794 RepID=A0A558BVU1_9BACT|nr:hypothetical protein [Hymenobacter setariae]TVT40646.1 hypothetical protein FNT36_14350 [Hymenobacter setariae]